MPLLPLNTAAGLEDAGLRKHYDRLQGLLAALRQRELQEDLIAVINQEILQLNAPKTSPAQLKRALLRHELRILRIVEKKVKLVPPGYYRQMWSALGISVYGLPLGVVFGLTMGNLGLMAIGLPIGLAIGMAVGSKMDQKAAQEGRQLIF